MKFISTYKRNNNEAELLEDEYHYVVKVYIGGAYTKTELFTKPITLEEVEYAIVDLL
jgi:hypothetical protein